MNWARYLTDTCRDDFGPSSTMGDGVQATSQQSHNALGLLRKDRVVLLKYSLYHSGASISDR
jgi:hypothetical protein